MKKTSPQQNYPDLGLSPLDEIRLFYTCFGPALKYIKWRTVIITVVLSFLSGFFVLMAATRLLDGKWDMVIVLPKAIIISSLMGLNVILMGVFPFMRERFKVETEKAKAKRELNNSKEMEGKKQI